MSQPSPLDPATVAVLRPAIIQILNNADLSSISAKKVRAQLAQLPPHALPPTLDLSASKKQVDEVIRDCFDHISKGMPAPPHPPTSYNGASSAPPSGGLALPGLGGVRGGHIAAPTSASSTTSSSKTASAKAAPASNGTKIKPEPKPKKKAAKKRAATDEDDDDEPRKKRAANPNNPFNRPLVLSPKLAEVCGGNEMPRHAVVKQLWVYIKSNNLQNESNKRQILCDAKLTSIFGKEAVE
uniref:Swib mdm2 domain-containing protein n=1 Tax=Melanopsichium pennsylvanicum 4 TaxID=1398559 RepID=A0A077QRY7_9BASI|nr:swib mdm2 domain-containing protein [Melanopsichium pennsylvanicum 4]